MGATMLDSRRRALRSARPIAVVLAVLASACASPAGRNAVPAPAEPAAVGPPVTLDAPPRLVVEAIVTDRKGVPVEGLGPRDFDVTVDGRRRLGVALARLYRGPGSDVLASTLTATRPGEVLPVAEQSRLVVLVVDQASLAPGDERRARPAAETCLGLLGLSDRVGIATLPPASSQNSVAFDRGAIRDKLAALRSLRAPDAAAAASGADEAFRPADDSPRKQGGVGDPAVGEAVPDRPDDRRVVGKPLGASMSGDAPPAALRAHAVSTLGELTRLFEALRQVPGGKTVVLVSAGLSATDAGAELAAAEDAAFRSHVRVFVLQVPSASSFGAAGARDLHLLAQDTGGLVVPLSAKPEQALQRLAGQLAFSYFLLLAPAQGDDGPAPHAVQVTLRGRSDLSVHVARRVAPGRATRAQLVTALSPLARVMSEPPLRPAPAPAPGVKPPAAPPFAHDHSVDVVLARLAQYVWAYGRELSSVVSEETYRQEARRVSSVAGDELGRKPADERRSATTLVSDYLLVKVPGIEGWLPFRDVFEVDGVRVRDRQDRLTKLFVEAPSPEAAVERAGEVFRESARFNVGGLFRTLNVPVVPLWFLERPSQRRFVFRKAGEDTLDGTRTWVIEFAEVDHPTIIRTPEGGDVPAAGRIWVEPLNGRVHKTLLKASVATITVTYGPRAEVPGLLLPLEMKEHYVAGRTVIDAAASYSKFRQFRVTTTERIVLPRK